jgi:glycosyltransferase involved in cell wall biosynthesis
MLDGDSLQRVAFVEPRCHGLEHVPFNAAMVVATAAAFPGSRVDVYGESGHLEELERLLSLTRVNCLTHVSWTPVSIPERRLQGRHRAVAVAGLFTRLDRAFRTRKPESLLVSTTDPFVLGILKPLLFTKWAGLPAVAIFHELLAVLGRRRKSMRRWGFAASLALPHPSGLTYMVLAASIREHLQQIAPHTAAHVLSCEHPSLLGDLATPTTALTVPPFRFGFVGGGRTAKGIMLFLALARAVRQKYPDVQFEIVGSVPADIPRDQLTGLSWSEDKLPLTEFVARLRNLTHVVWLGDPEHYRLVASGSLTDTIALGVPLICQRGPLVDHMFELFGNLGVRANSAAELEGALTEIVTRFSNDDYRRQREAAQAAGAALTPEALAPMLRSALAAPR